MVLAAHGELRPPSLDEWLDGLTAVIGGHSRITERRAGIGAQAFGLPTGWGDLAQAEQEDLDWASALEIAQALSTHPWLRTTERVAEQQGFFHWELDFAGVFARGGFDLQVGNPPWVRPALTSTPCSPRATRGGSLPSNRRRPRSRPSVSRHSSWMGCRDLVVDGTVDVARATFVGSPTIYPYLAGLQPDLYRCFMEQTWRHMHGRGASALIHPETPLHGREGRTLSRATYARLRRHWQFVNELSLFEIDDHTSLRRHVYAVRSRPAVPQWRRISTTPRLSSAHSDTRARARTRSQDRGWQVGPAAPHGRITQVDDETLALVARAAGRRHDAGRSHPYGLRRQSRDRRRSREAGRGAAARLSSDSSSPAGWHENNDSTEGYFDVEWGGRFVGLCDPAGPALFVGNPFYKSPNPTMLHNQDWSPVDLESLARRCDASNAYKPASPRAEYDAAYTDWGATASPRPPVSTESRGGHGSQHGERTLIPRIDSARRRARRRGQALGMPGSARTNSLLVAATSRAALRSTRARSSTPAFDDRSVPACDAATHRRQCDYGSSLYRCNRSARASA